MRRKKRYGWLFYMIPALFLIVVLAVSSIRALQIYLPQQQAQNDMARLRDEISHEDPEENPTSAFVNRYASLMAKNADFACWLKIPDSVIDYPVMKSSEDDPEFYLKRGFDKEYSAAGCLFIGGGCNLDSLSYIIYGHNMAADIMFGELDLFEDSEYALEHRLIHVGTPTEDRTYRVFAAFQTQVNSSNSNVFRYYEKIGDLDESAYNDTVKNVRAMSLIDLADAPSYPAQLLFLSTCSFHTQDGRFVVAAYRTDVD